MPELGKFLESSAADRITNFTSYIEWCYVAERQLLDGIDVDLESVYSLENVTPSPLADFLNLLRTAVWEAGSYKDINEFKFICQLVTSFVFVPFEAGMVTRSKNDQDRDKARYDNNIKAQIQNLMKSSSKVAAAIQPLIQHPLFGSGLSKIQSRFENSKLLLISTYELLDEYKLGHQNQGAILFELAQFDKRYDSKEFVKAIERDLRSMTLIRPLEVQTTAEKLWLNFTKSRSSFIKRGTIFSRKRSSFWHNLRNGFR